MKTNHRTLTLFAATLFITACEQSTSPDKAIATSSTSSSSSTSTSTTTTTTTPTTVTSTTLAPTTTSEKPVTETPLASGAASAQTLENRPAENPPATSEAPAQTTEKSPADNPLASGEALAQKSGCFACHAIDRKLVGPPWRDVAKLYRGAADAKPRLIAKVSAGGMGNWTEITGGVAMPPYSPRVSDSDIATLVDFILALPEQPN